MLSELPRFFSCLMICFWLCWIFTAASAFLAVESGCYFLTVVLGLLLAVTSLVVEHGSRAPWLQHVGSRVAARRLNCSSIGMWDLPISGLNPTSSALAGRLFTTKPPRSPEIT